MNTIFWSNIPGMNYFINIYKKNRNINEIFHKCISIKVTEQIVDHTV